MGFRSWLQSYIFGDNRELLKFMESVDLRRDYRRGRQREQIKVKLGQANDNVFLNYIDQVAEQSVYFLLGGGVEFQYPDYPQGLIERMNATWDANKQKQLLMRLAMFGAEAGTCYLRLLPKSQIVKRTGEMVTRLVALDPKYVEMFTEPQDGELVNRYEIKYVYKNVKGEEVGHKTAFVLDGIGLDTVWTIQEFETDKSGRWIALSPPVLWAADNGDPYSFAPIVHWQNLPRPDDVYGEPDITDDVICLQDRINFVASNIQKIIRYHAHPQTIFVGAAPAKIDNEPAVAWSLPDPSSNAFNLEMQSDLASSMAYLDKLTKTLFQSTNTVDVSVVKDKIGSLTNFGVRLLYQAAMSKMDTKRELYGEALAEVNRRLMILDGVPEQQADGGEVIFHDPLPVNSVEEMTAIQQKLQLGLMSKASAAEELGIDWEAEKVRLAEDKAGEDNVGSMLIRAFNSNRNQPPPL